MEDGWERPARVQLTSGLLCELIEPAFPGQSVASFAILPSGLANTCVRFTLRETGESYVMRIHTRDPKAAALEQGVMAFLRKHESPIPVAGLRHTCLDTHAIGFPYTIWEYVEATELQTLFGRLENMQMQEIAGACGHVLAAFSGYRFPRCAAFNAQMELAQEYGPPSKFTEAFAYEALFSGRAGGRLGTVVRDELWRTIQRHSPARQA